MNADDTAVIAEDSDARSFSVNESLSDALSAVYDQMQGSDVSAAYSIRHGIRSAAILTVHNDEIAAVIADELAPRIAGRTVVEIGGGIGLLALHLGQYAKRVYCIEANPMWSSSFVACLLRKKPKNVSYLFGAADEFAGSIRGEVAIFVTHSGVDDMRRTAGLFADTVIDVWGEIIASDPDSFDKAATQLRRIA